MAFGDNESMKVSNREAIPDGIRKFVFSNYSVTGYLTEETVILVMLVRFNDFAEIRIVAIPFHGIAAVAEGLKIVDVVAAAPVSWRDVVNL